VIAGFIERPQRDAQQAREVPGVKATESFGDVAGCRSTRPSDLIAKIEVMFHLGFGKKCAYAPFQLTRELPDLEIPISTYSHALSRSMGGAKNPEPRTPNLEP
jgi:hypothetical protein